jgi:hypothetical protein
LTFLVAPTEIWEHFVVQPRRCSRTAIPQKTTTDPSAVRRDNKLAHTEASAREAGSVGKQQERASAVRRVTRLAPVRPRGAPER